MNDEKYLSMELTIGLKKSIKNENNYQLDIINEELEFEFSDDREENNKIYDPQKWLEKCKENGIKEAYLYSPKMGDYELNVYANGNPVGILTIDIKNNYYYWHPYWNFNKENNKWEIKYKEHKFINFSKDRIILKDNTLELKKALISIRDFAKTIEMYYYSNKFDLALCILEKKEIPNNYEELLLKSNKLDLEGDKKIIIDAINQASVFGGMGSWNDSPYAYAMDFNKIDEYKKVSNELWIQLNNAMFYAINS